MTNVTLHPDELAKVQAMFNDEAQHGALSDMFHLYEQHGITVTYLARVLNTSSYKVRAIMDYTSDFPAHLIGTTCLHGHPRNASNTYIRGNGQADCRVCRRRYVKAYYKKQKQQQQQQSVTM